MVQVTREQNIDYAALESSQQWLAQIPIQYNEEQQAVIAKAFNLAKDLTQPDQSVASIHDGFAIAEVLVSLHVDASTLASALIYPFFHSKQIDQENLTKQLNLEISELCRGVEAMDVLQSVQNKHVSANDDGQQTDSFRRMLLAMVDDVRLVLIKLAERLTYLRQVKDKSRQQRILAATEVKEIYAPLANRLGIGQLKWEMEDLAFRYLHSEEYKSIAKNLAEKRLAREDYVSRVLETITEKLQSVGINNAEVMGRAKHIYSIWRKMQRKNVGFEEIYDVRAVRVLVDEIPQCYATLGIVHGEWQHIPKEFDDYIATPKENGYQSLHTAVVGPEGKTIEVQIRTKQMHQDSELGVAAHWRYKEGAKEQKAGFEAKISWLRQLLEWQEEVADANELLDGFKSQVIEDRIYVFTPQGKVIDLPMGATPLDFAYHVHTQVGHNCRGAKVAGRIVPLTYQLQTGEQVEILTTKNGQPSRDWLNPHNGYIRSSRARSKIHQWFRHQDKDKNAAAGRTIFDKELARHGLENADLERLAKKFNFHFIEDLYAAIGAGDVGINQVLNSARAIQPTQQQDSTEFKPQTRKKKSSTKGIQIEGIGDLMSSIAGCCKPVPGDAVKGYITQGRGVVVHRQDCSYILNADKSRKERLIDVSWGTVDDTYSVDIYILAFDRKGLLKDISTVFANEKVGVESMNSAQHQKAGYHRFDVRLSIENTDRLSRVLAQLQQVSNVVEVKRKR
ncbi:MAG: GTP diphosphokinase [Kangiellaceae bacterium]|jgi:GTP pyrophosphokinase|nr:GTP diphosphokinase [Kangiellaceae bacterium]